MKNITHRTVKSITRNALFISMILHVFFLTALFYFTVRNQPIFPFQDKLDATIETLPKQLSKKPMKTPIREHRKTTVFQAAKMPSTTVETPKPQMPFQPRVGTNFTCYYSTTETQGDKYCPRCRSECQHRAPRTSSS